MNHHSLVSVHLQEFEESDALRVSESALDLCRVISEHSPCPEETHKAVGVEFKVFP